MEFDPQNEKRIDEMQLQELSEARNDLQPGLAEDESKPGEAQLVHWREKLHDLAQASFQNVAFRDSGVSTETNGSEVTGGTSVQQVEQRDPVRTTEDHTEQLEECRGSGNEREPETGNNTQTVIVDVHNVANDANIPSSNGNVAKHKRKAPSKGKVIWTYSL